MPEIWLTSKCWICFGRGLFPKNNKNNKLWGLQKMMQFGKMVFIRSFEKTHTFFKSIFKATLYKEYIHSLHFKPRPSMGLLYLPTFGREIYHSHWLFGKGMHLWKKDYSSIESWKRTMAPYIFFRVLCISNPSGQITTASTEVTPNGGLVRESYPKCPDHSGLGILP